MVYIRFEDDMVTLPQWNSWPNPANMYDVEPWMSSSIDPNFESRSDEYFNLSNYYRTVSGDSLVPKLSDSAP
jgi:hypothetical protein